MDPVSDVRIHKARQFPRLLAILAFVFLFVGAIFAQDVVVEHQIPPDTVEIESVKPPEPPQYDKSHLWRVAGRVVNSATGQPVSRALVMLESAVSLSVLTDARGAFSFESIPQGPARISASRPGFSAEAHGRRKPGVFSRPTVFKVTADNETLVVSLSPLAAISGRITGPDDEPVEWLPVSLVRVGVSAGKSERIVLGGHGTAGSQALTDEDGRFRIANLEPGNYLIRVGPMSTFDEQDVAYPVVFYPGVDDKSLASRIEVGPGERAEASFVARPVQAAPVSGTVTGIAGGDDQKVYVAITDKSGEAAAPSMAVTLPEGAFYFPSIPFGTYTVVATRFNLRDEQKRQFASQVVTVSESTQPLQLALHAVRSAPVNIRTEFDQPQRRWEYLNIQTTRVDGAGGTSMDSVREAPNGGEMKFTAPGAGTYTFHFLMSSQNIYIASAKCGNVDLLTQPLTIPDSGMPGPIDIVLRDSGGEVTGTVEGDGDVTTIWLIPQSTSSGRTESMQLPLNLGKAEYYFGGVVPGDYRIVAIYGEQDTDDNDKAATDRLRSMGTPVQVTARTASQVALRVVEIEP